MTAADEQSGVLRLADLVQPAEAAPAPAPAEELDPELVAILQEVAAESARDASVVRAVVESGTFVVDTEGKANWAVRLIRARQLRAQALKDQAAAIVSESRAEDGKAAWLLRAFGPDLERWAAPRMKDAKRRSLRLTDGTVKYQHIPASVKVLDENRAIEAAAQAGVTDAVTTKTVTTFHKKPILAWFNETGETVDGCEIRDKRYEFRVGGG